jgi:pimeloyl-ACP methyl ester carboxylesterase
MPIATIDGVDLYFELHGTDGEPLVLVHGYTGDVTDWRHQLPEFAKTHRVLAFDHRGHGRSQAPARDAYSIERMADDAEALARHVGFERYHLLGHSMGGAVVQEIALRSPGRLLSLTLEDTSYGFGFSRNEAVARWSAQRHRMAEEQGMAAVANVPSPIPLPPHMPPSRRDEEKERLSRMAVEAFIGAWNALGAWPGTRDRASGIAASTLIICGELDAPLVEPSRTLAELIPGAALEVIPEAAHSPQFERPDLFNAALRRHLDRNAGASAK